MPRPKKGEGHPKPEVAAQIEVLSAIGTPTRAMMALVGIGSLETLHKHYKEQLEIGADKANAKIGGVIYRAASKGEPWACQMIAKTRMGWKETTVQEQVGKDGGPIQSEATIKADDTLVKLFDEVAGLKAALAKQGGLDTSRQA